MRLPLTRERFGLLRVLRAVQVVQRNPLPDAIEHDINNILGFRTQTCSLATLPQHGQTPLPGILHRAVCPGDPAMDRGLSDVDGRCERRRMSVERGWAAGEFEAWFESDPGRWRASSPTDLGRCSWCSTSRVTPGSTRRSRSATRFLGATYFRTDKLTTTRRDTVGLETAFDALRVLIDTGNRSDDHVGRSIADGAEVPFAIPPRASLGHMRLLRFELTPS